MRRLKLISWAELQPATEKEKQEEGNRKGWVVFSAEMQQRNSTVDLKGQKRSCRLDDLRTDLAATTQQNSLAPPIIPNEKLPRPLNAG